MHSSLIDDDPSELNQRYGAVKKGLPEDSAGAARAKFARVTLISKALECIRE